MDATSDEMRNYFEGSIYGKYDVDLLSQAHWYLQSRVTQHANFDVTVDQSRYTALICGRFLPSLGVNNVTPSKCKKYAAPLPTDFMATNAERSKNHLEVLELPEEFGFEYASVVGMLIYLMNTTLLLHFAISKLAKLNTLPGRDHFKAARHLLRYLRCHYLSFGLTYYSDPKRSPVYKLVHEFIKAHADAPLILFTDSSWQDCPDTGRSTGGLLLYHQGGLVDGGSFVPNPVALASTEPEYNALAHAMQDTIGTRQLIQELYGNHPDTPLTIPCLCDSESAIIIGSNLKDTKRTRHIQCRIHYARDNIAAGAFEPENIEGELNPADVGTKNLASDVLERHCEVVYTVVKP